MVHGRTTQLLRAKLGSVISLLTQTFHTAAVLLHSIDILSTKESFKLRISMQSMRHQYILINLQLGRK